MNFNGNLIITEIVISWTLILELKIGFFDDSNSKKKKNYRELRKEKKDGRVDQPIALSFSRSSDGVDSTLFSAENLQKSFCTS